MARRIFWCGRVETPIWKVTRGKPPSAVGEETNRVEADRESIARMTGATAGLAIDRECPDR